MLHFQKPTVENILFFQIHVFFFFQRRLPSSLVWFLSLAKKLLHINKIMFQKLLTQKTKKRVSAETGAVCIKTRTKKKAQLYDIRPSWTHFFVCLSYVQWSLLKLSEIIPDDRRDTSSVDTGEKEFSAAAVSDRCSNPLRRLFFVFLSIPAMKMLNAHISTLNQWNHNSFFLPAARERRAEEAESSGRPRGCSFSTKKVVI